MLRTVAVWEISWRCLLLLRTFVPPAVLMMYDRGSSHFLTTVPRHHVLDGLSSILTFCPGYSGCKSSFLALRSQYFFIAALRSSSLFLIVSSDMLLGSDGRLVIICLSSTVQRVKVALHQLVWL